MSIEIRELKAGDKATLRDFLGVVDTIYKHSPYYVRPLDFDVSDRLDHQKNPFFEHADGTAWVAYRDGRPVGRISAQVDREHLRVHRDDAGMFGFLDTVEEAGVAAALLAEAEAWVRARGMKRIRGPMSLSIYEEIGCLVEGFDDPPMAMMTYHNRYQGGLIEQAGYAKLKDLYSWKYDVGDVPPRAQRAHDEIAAMPEVTSRQADPKKLLDELRVIMDIFNDAWSDNWGHVPITANELAKMAKDMSLIIMPELTRMTYINGEAAAVAIGIPNLNEAIRDLDGQLFPFGILKLLWRLKVAGTKTGRLLILGIRKKWRHVRRYGGLSAYLYVEMNHSAHLLGMKGGELGWTLEDNAPINAGIRLMGGRIEKRFRVYEKQLP
jgi:GNAT superfamily N-acetyltransferase